jgi:hypothetical protein
MMKNKIYLFGIFLLLVFSACEKDEHEVISIKPEATGVFVDTRDGHEYKWVRLGNLDWMVENLVYGVGDFVEPYYNIDDPDDKQMEDFMRNMEIYGGLYPYDIALTAAPEGWRAATDEDWKNLEQVLGMDSDELDKEGYRGDRQGELMQQDSVGTGLCMQLGGFFNYYGTRRLTDYMGVYGFFWAISPEQDEAEDVNAIYRKISYDLPKVYRGTTLKIKQMSIRCVRDAVKE